MPFPYFPAFVELVADGGSSLVVLTYSVNNAYSRVQIGTRLTHSVISVSWTCMLFHTSFVKWSRGSEASLRERWCSWLPSGRILKRLLPCELCIELKLILYRYEGRIDRAVTAVTCPTSNRKWGLEVSIGTSSGSYSVATMFAWKVLFVVQSRVKIVKVESELKVKIACWSSTIDSCHLSYVPQKSHLGILMSCGILACTNRKHSESGQCIPAYPTFLDTRVISKIYGQIYHALDLFKRYIGWNYQI